MPARLPCLAVALALSLAHPRAAMSADISSSAPSLGAHAFLGQAEGLGVSPARTPPLTTRPAGSVFIAFNAGYASNDARPADTHGNTWKRLGHAMTYAGYGDRFSVSAWITNGGKGGEGHSVSIEKRGEPAGELSMPFVEVRDATRVRAFAQSYAEPSLIVASDEITVDGPATLLAFWWGDGGVKRMTVTPGDGFQLIDAFVELPDESGVQGAVAWRQVEAAGTYRVHWTAAPVQGAALWIIAFR